jgi:AcrR family transcriptional regulator
MARWEPDAPGRLAEAALDLFGERGYDQTTVEDIAARAGVTKRTFFRHYGDKREVLFAGGEEFEDLFLSGARAAPESATPLEAVARTFDGISVFFADRHAFARRRQRVIAANPELQERELAKLAAVTTALTALLRERGVPDPAASVTGVTAMAVFHDAFERWVTAENAPPLGDMLRESLDALRTVVSPTTVA